MVDLWTKGRLHIIETGCVIDEELGSVILDMYSKHGCMEEAQQMFDILPMKDLVAWGTIISGYATESDGFRALEMYELMQGEGLKADKSIYSSILKASAKVESTMLGFIIHDQVVKKGFHEDLVVGTSLIDMYSQCANLECAQKVFDQLSARDVVSWSSLIGGYVQQGQGHEAAKCFEKMQHDGLSPNSITFLCVLNACSQGGLVEKGQLYFETFITDYGVSPTIEHYNCMVQLLGQFDCLKEAKVMLQTMTIVTDMCSSWLTLLIACRCFGNIDRGKLCKWGNIELGRYAFERAIQLDEKDVSVYVCMCNIYVDASMEEEAKAIDAMRLRVEYEAQ